MEQTWKHDAVSHALHCLERHGHLSVGDFLVSAVFPQSANLVACIARPILDDLQLASLQREDRDIGSGYQHMVMIEPWQMQLCQGALISQ